MKRRKTNDQHRNHKNRVKIAMLIIMSLSWLAVMGTINYTRAVDTVTPVRYTTQPVSDAYNYGVWSNYVGGTRVTGMESYLNQRVEVTKEAVASNGKWLEFKVNGKVIGWVGEKGVEPTKTEVLYPATTKDDAYNYGVWSNYIGGTRVTGLTDFEGKQLEVTKEATVSGSIWVEFKVNGRVIGWVNKSGVNEGDSIVKSMNLTGKHLAQEDAIHLKWNALDKSEPYTYQVYSKKPGMTEFQTISATDLNKKVKVLNVHPIVGGDITYTTHDGTTRTVPKAASAEKWMEEPNEYHAKGFGMGLIDVEPVDIDTFNTQSQTVMKNADGSWKYDVVFFGSYDSNGSKDLSVASSDTMIEFIKTGRGVLLGHDVIASAWSMPQKITDVNFGRLMPYMNIEKVPDEYDYISPLNIPLKYQIWGSDQVELTSSGLLNSYPWDIGDLGTELNIPYTHTGWLVHKGERWLKFKNVKNISANVIPRADLYMANENPEMNAYLTTWSNTAMIQTGHSNGNATLDEQKILANTLFYLSQLTSDTQLTDRSAMEIYPPEFESKEYKVTREASKIKIDFPDAKEVPSEFEYYVESTGQNTGKKQQSEVIKVDTTSGFSGYSYVNDSNPTTVPDNKVETTTSTIEIPNGANQPKYVHVVAVDKKGNKSEPLHIVLDNTPPKLEVTKGTEGWTKNEVIYTIKVSDDESGVNSLTIPERGVYTYKGEKNPTSTYGTYTTNGKRRIVAEDMAGNKAEVEIDVNNIDTGLPGLTVDYTPKGWTNQNIAITAKGTDTLSGIRNVRMETDRTSKNILPLADLQGFGVKDLKKEGYGVRYSTDGTQQYEGITISDKITEPNEWYVLSFDITKLSGTIPNIGGHSHIASESKVYIDGKLVETGSHIAWDTSVPYPNDNKKHRVRVVFYTGNYTSTGDKKLYIQPTRRNIGYPYEVEISNVQLEKGKEETPYEPNYIDILQEKNPLTVNVSENGVYKFITTDNAGNEYAKSVTIDKIDKVKPTVETENMPTGWTGNSVTFKVIAYDEQSGIEDIVSDNPDGGYVTTQGNKHVYTYTAYKSGDYDFVVTDKAGNETKHRVTVNNIDKDSPDLKVDVSTKEWTNGNVRLTATGKDLGSGVKNIRMATDVESKNLVAMSDIQLWYGKEHSVQGKAFKFKQGDTNGYGGLYIPASLIEADQWYTLSFDITKVTGNIPYLGGHMHISTEGSVYIDGEKWGSLDNTSRHDFNRMEYPNDTKKHHVTVHFLTNEYSKNGDKNVYIQPNRSSYGEDYEVVIENIQLEKGQIETSYEPHYLDLLDNVNPLVVNVSENGKYSFTATDNVGNETIKSIEINNIDKEVPTVKVSGNPNTYVDEATLQINAEDKLSGVKSITLPDGEVFKGNKTSFKVNANGQYVFTITDNAGNTTKETVEVTKMTIPYMFYLYDAFGKPIKGSGFDLLRDGVKFASSISDENGLVDFGRVPGDGKYTIKQTKAPDGYVIDPNEKDVEVGDTTEPEEFINYPRGTILPATGTMSKVIFGSLVGLTVSSLYLIKRKKRKLTGSTDRN